MDKSKDVDQVVDRVDQAQDANGSDVEYSHGPVPASQRKGFFSLVFVWIGYVFTVTIMSAGGNIANGSPNFMEAFKAVAVGYAILITIGTIVGLIACETGLTYGLMTRYTFGTVGTSIISFGVTVTLLGWFSINCYLIGSLTNTLFPVIPLAPMSIIAGIAMTWTALKGVEIMNKLGSVATILVAVFGAWSLVLAIRDVGGLEALKAIEHTNTLPFNQVVTIAVIPLFVDQSHGHRTSYVLRNRKVRLLLLWSFRSVLPLRL